MAENRMQLNCCFCELSLTTYHTWLSHIRLVHCQEPGFFIKCGIDGCCKTYNNFSAFNSHVYRHHRDKVCKPTTSQEVSEMSNSDMGTAESYLGADLVQDFNHDAISDHPATLNMTQVEIAEILGDAEVQQKRQCAHFLLGLKEKFGVSQKALDNIVATYGTFLNFSALRVQAGVRQILSAKGIDVTTLPELEELFENLSSPFVGLSSAYLQMQYYKDHFGLIEPVEIDLNAPSHVLESAGSKRQHNTIQSSKFCYISIIDSLKAMLKNEDVLKEVLCSHKSSGAKLGDFCDGEALRRDQVFSDFNALQIVAYYDDLEICNPLGAASKRHKIGVFFFFLGNIHPRYRSSLSISQLFAVAKSIDIKTYGIDEILKPFVSEIKILATEGLTIEHGGVNHTFKGNLIAFLADNLASHTVGGFKESMGFAFRFCRKCLATKQQSRTRFTSSQFVQRTPSEHAQQCQRLTGPLKDHYSVTYGITRNAILNTIPNFSVVTGLCHDIMHDLFEGVAPLEMKLLIQYCVQNGYFSLRDLNTRISQFDFGYSNTSDKPAKFEESSTGKLKLTASSMWLLARMLPIIIGELVPENEKNWQCYITLLKIINICTSHECTVDTVAYLSSLIEEHHKIFTEIYPGEFIPKMHSMVHYPEQILEFGPIINTWCMRMEAKLRICKRIAKFGNFKNVCLSVTRSHQRWMCLQLQSKTFLKSPPEFGGRLVTHTIQEEDANVRDILTQIIRTLSTHTQYVIFHPTWVKLQNTEYKRGAIILTGFNNQLPVFGKIIDLCVIDDSLWFIYEQFKTNWFDLHYHSFCVTPTTSLSYISLSQLAYPFVLHVYSVQNCCYVVLKYGLDFL